MSMRVLIAEDEPISRRMLEVTLARWKYDVVATCDGKQALETLQRKETPRLAILDWMMPHMDGIEVCRRIRQMPSKDPPYIILLTAKCNKQDIVKGLEAGADDYVAKPFDRAELRARIRVGMRILEMQNNLANQVAELQDALSRVKQLQGLIPICAYCKKVRDDHNFWQQVEAYLAAHSEARFSHGICPGCMQSVVKPEIEALRQKPSFWTTAQGS
jgi:CheY-like chemotaxis protein